MLILSGPTGVGKSALSIHLAKELQGEIISADSMQVYKGMEIASDVLPVEKREGVRHHLLSFLEIKETFDVAEFCRLTKALVEEIHERGHLPILVGGTAFYLQAFLYQIPFDENADDRALRDTLEAWPDEKIDSYLEEHDALSREKIPLENRRRRIRAVSFHMSNGKTLSSHNEEMRRREAAYLFHYACLKRKRESLYERIDRRVDEMLKEGLLDEARKLKEAGLVRGMCAMQALGIKELYPYLEGEKSLEECVQTLKQETRHYAKRQETFFRRERDIHFYPMDTKEEEEATFHALLREGKALRRAVFGEEE